MAEINPVYRRGDIVQARFDPTEGSEQSGVRPAIVISPDVSNRRSPLLILAPLTTRNVGRVYPHEVAISQGNVVKIDSKILLGQLRSMSKSRVLSYYGPVSDATMIDVDAALQIAVGLDKI